MHIGEVVDGLIRGKRYARGGWNGKEMSIELQVPDAHSKMTQPYVFINAKGGSRVPWLCSQSDLLATDWFEVPPA
jgi:hypothetical protein